MLFLQPFPYPLSVASYLYPYSVLHDLGAGTQDTAAHTASLPAYQEGDLLLMVVNSANQSISAPTGWTEWSAGLVGSGTPGDAAAVGLQIFWKRAAASETAPSIDDSGDHTCVRIYAISGAVKSGTPLGNISTGVEATTTTTFTWPSVTTQADGNAVLFIGSHDISSTQTERFNAPSNANVTLQQDMPGVGGTVGSGGGFNGFLFHCPTAGAIGTTSGSINLSGVLAFATIEVISDGTGIAPYIADVSALSATSGTPDITLPSNVQSDDILILLYQNQNDGTPTTPTGWTLKGNDVINGVGLWVFWRRADGTANDDPTLDDAGAYNAAKMLVVRGCPTTGDPFDQFSIGTFGTGPATFAEVTTVTDGCLIINWAANDADSSGAGVNTFTPHANLSEGFFMDYCEHGWITFGGGGMGGGCGVLPTAGASGQSTCTFGTGTASKVIVTMALKPAS